MKTEGNSIVELVVCTSKAFAKQTSTKYKSRHESDLQACERRKGGRDDIT